MESINVATSPDDFDEANLALEKCLQSSTASEFSKSSGAGTMKSRRRLLFEPPSADSHEKKSKRVEPPPQAKAQDVLEPPPRCDPEVLDILKRIERKQDIMFKLMKSQIVSNSVVQRVGSPLKKPSPSKNSSPQFKFISWREQLNLPVMDIESLDNELTNESYRSQFMKFLGHASRKGANESIKLQLILNEVFEPDVYLKYNTNGQHKKKNICLTSTMEHIINFVAKGDKSIEPALKKTLSAWLKSKYAKSRREKKNDIAGNGGEDKATTGDKQKEDDEKIMKDTGVNNIEKNSENDIHGNNDGGKAESSTTK